MVANMIEGTWWFPTNEINKYLGIPNMYNKNWERSMSDEFFDKAWKMAVDDVTYYDMEDWVILTFGKKCVWEIWVDASAVNKCIYYYIFRVTTLRETLDVNKEQDREIMNDYLQWLSQEACFYEMFLLLEHYSWEYEEVERESSERSQEFYEKVDTDEVFKEKAIRTIRESFIISKK